MTQNFSFDRLLQHKTLQFPLNIKIGEMQTKFLSAFSDVLLCECADQLKQEIQKGEMSEYINSKAKAEHILNMLERVKSRRYNFRRQNIEEGEKLNSFYRQADVTLPQQERKYPCTFCGERFFTTNASLHSHYRSCVKYKESGNCRVGPYNSHDFQQRENGGAILTETDQNASKGFQKLLKGKEDKNECNQLKPSLQKAKQLPVEIIAHQSKTSEKEKLREEFAQMEFEERPRKTFNPSLVFQSEIFCDDD